MKFSFTASVCIAPLLALSVLSTPALAQPDPVATQITGYWVFGNTLLPTDVVLAVVEGRVGRMGFADIQKTAQLLQAKYREYGYGAVIVQVPDQTLSQGVVRLEVVEGKLSQVQVTGNQQFSKGNIARSLPALEPGATPSLFALDRQLLMVNENPAKAVRVVFQPGEKHGQVEAMAIVEEQPVERWNVSFDNSGNDATGNYRLSLGYLHANVDDRDTQLSARAVTSPTDPSQVAILSASLKRPLYSRAAFVEVSALASSTRNTPTQTGAGELRFSGQGNSVGARGIWLVPFLGETKHQLSAGVESRSYTNTCSLGSFGAAGCGSAGASVDVMPLTLGYLLQKPGQWNASVQWAHNLPWTPQTSDDARFHAARSKARRDYQFLRYSFNGSLPVTSVWSAVARLEGQWSDQPLVGAEQFGAGGANSVRGYPERVISGDAGAVASLELRAPWGFWQAGSESDVVLGVFADAGHVALQGGGSCATGRAFCDISSVGVSTLWKASPRTLVRADLGRAGEAAADTKVGDWSLHVNLTHNF
ncbi:ShlB/FhaC/HecB family hemolysin secretion/activation protein [Curvibacter sp. APW13]|uniref:ShlB/FhaC/HecB family hemolysin secretion/activation protein n=1 Tax=Curvibacter sp. APW13 TaxID=3077236 RepID=UPI0028DE85FF|nr:ShlB/FhaC/HecB family hemolysin secretion/activation protein [Curvibacter sp. APW13]MDT8991517.1 ShlB/FhaC/HecB family hemolysin secretion/activation protein [Curvibacter sp. APW13]